ncbi:hypothetical protein AB7W40_16880 [Providencia rettgeri]
MLMQQLKLNTNKIINTILYILLLTILPYSSMSHAGFEGEIFKLIRHADGSATIEMGADFEFYASLAQPEGSGFKGCYLGDTVSLMAGNKSGGWSIIDVPGTADGNCFTPLRPKFPVKIAAGNTALLFIKEGICIGRGKLGQVEWQFIDFCVGDDSIIEIIGDAVCKITPIEIVHDYGLVNTSEINGKSITTDATITCTHEKITTGDVSVSLEFQNLVDDKLYLRDDKSIYSTLDLDDKGPSENIKVPVNQSINVKVRSTLSANDNVIGGDFSGSTLLVMTYN